MKYSFKLLVILGVFLLGCNDDDEPKSAPEATDVSVVLREDTAVGDYTYTDQDSDKEGRSVFQWYIADDEQGTNKTAISDATSKIYDYRGTEAGKYLSFAVTPVQEDRVSGEQTHSDFEGPIKISGEQAESKDYLVLYSVSGDNIKVKKVYGVPNILLVWQNDTEKHKEMWKQLLKIVPEKYLSKISEFMIFVGDYYATSDFYETLGYVHPTSGDLTKWRFGLAIDYAYATSFSNAKHGLNGTITHEFGHIVTLNDTQLDPSVSTSSCKTYHPGEGCAFEASYLNYLYQNYWADISEDNSAKTNYTAHPGEFITYYSATDPAEDIAETYRYYVLQSIPTSATPVYNQKILDLDKHEEMQKLRAFARKNLGTAGVYSLRHAARKDSDRKFRCATRKILNKEISIKQ